MATKTRSKSKNTSSVNVDPDKMKQSSHLSSLMMLSQQLISLGRFNKGLPSLLLKGADSEQIWQQLELRNNHQLALSKCTKEVVQISNRKRLKRDKKVEKQKETKITKDEVDDCDDHGSSSDSDVDGALNDIKNRLANSEDDRFLNFDGSDGGDSDLDFDFDIGDAKVKNKDKDDDDAAVRKQINKSKKKRSSNNKPSVVDDKFFKLSDMEDFLDAEDNKEEKRLKKESKKKKKPLEDDESSEESDDEDDDIDLFAADADDNDEGANARYTDFFDPPEEAGDEVNGENKDEESGPSDKENEDDEAIDDEEDMNVDEGESEEEEDMKDEDEEIDTNKDEEEASLKGKSKKKVSFSQDLLASDEDEKPDVEDLSKKDKQSTFEQKQETLMKKAREMEELSLQQPSWELTGEVISSKRPENSLLETVVDFQHTTRAAPVITDDTTKSLEDYIKQRIRDKTFDDVERKEKPKEDVFEFKKRITLDQEKSKQSLAEIYEQEFIKQQKKDTEEVKADPECEKIEKDLNKLFFQLDALCNFRYTPMKPGTEVKIVVNTPAITMEEVAPVATTDADLLAPEEVMAKRKEDLKAVEERDTTDRKRARRQKKLEKREKKKAKEAREKKVAKLKPGLGNKYSKEKALKDLEKLSKSDKSIHVIKDGGKKLASSSSFFSQLQDEVMTQAKSIKAKKEKKKKKTDASALLL